jgi:transaldolase
MNPLLRLCAAGQSVWLDSLRRSLITGGGLERLTREDGVSGVTSNPSIFGKAIVGSTDYDEAIRVIAGKDGRPPIDIFYDLALADVTITLLFSVELYEKVALAYIRGLERRLDGGQPVDRMASVASFFVSRVDAAVDELLPEGSPLCGKVAIANAKRAYHRFPQLFSGERWERLARAGARVQRPLWASTGTKDPTYSDVLYVEELVGPDTVTTVPEATLDAFRDHGVVRPGAALEGLEETETILGLLPEQGIDLGEITERLAEEGLAAFQANLDELLEVIAGKLEDVPPAVVGERNTDRCGHADGAPAQPLAAEELRGPC